MKNIFFCCSVSKTIVFYFVSSACMFTESYYRLHYVKIIESGEKCHEQEIL